MALGEIIHQDGLGRKMADLPDFWLLVSQTATAAVALYFLATSFNLQRPAPSSPGTPGFYLMLFFSLFCLISGRWYVGA